MANQKPGRSACGSKKEVEEAARKIYVPPFLVALPSLGLGDKEAALDWLEKAYQERSPWLTHLRVEPALDSLTSDTRFLDLVKRVGLPRPEYSA